MTEQESEPDLALSTPHCRKIPTFVKIGLSATMLAFGRWTDAPTCKYCNGWIFRQRISIKNSQ